MNERRFNNVILFIRRRRFFMAQLLERGMTAVAFKDYLGSDPSIAALVGHCTTTTGAVASQSSEIVV